ncbi:alpha/beta hydrolase [Intrasporangium flavum]|uniref:alpha/beta hydrolase n=1 Tax=Intrasporangium flavum TaxID=1428657 RepID=UPI0009700BDE|nr:alpha/beta hydrolase [Intrasporangium flavum]
MDRRPHPHRRTPSSRRPTRGSLRDRLALAAVTLATLLVGAAPAVGQSISDGTPVQVSGPRATVLSSDARHGRLVEAFGDVRRARHIAVIVPGVGWTGPLLRDEHEAGRRHPAVQARTLLAEMQRSDPHTPAAVVVWLDYDAPAGLDADAARSDRALDGAPRLVAFVDHLPRSATVSLVCHSYGSVVCGHAAPRLRVSNLVVVGSPGMDVWTRSALRTRATVWAGVAADDPIGLVPHTRLEGFGHAADPTSPSFGARPLPVGGAHGHNGYLAAGTDSVRAVAQIATGQGARVPVVGGASDGG